MIANAAHFQEEFGQGHVADLLQRGWTICLAPGGVWDDAKIAYDGLNDLLACDAKTQASWAGGVAHQGQIDSGLRPVEQTNDPKRIFHYRLGLEAELAAQGIDVAGRWGAFLQASQRNRARCKKLEARVCAGLGVGDPFADHDFVRILRYDPAPIGTVMGRPHWDRCAFSFLFAGTHPGVRIPENDAYEPSSPELSVVGLDAHQVLITISAKLAGLTGGRLRPIWHDVISTAAAVYRNVQVFFTHCGLPDEVMPAGFKTHDYDSLARLVRAYHAGRPAA